MTAIDDLLERALGAWDRGDPQPADLAGKLSRSDAYGMLMAVRRRREADGRRVVGWKVGQTSAAMRAERGESQPAAGFLLDDLAHPSGSTLTIGAAENWFIEPELALVVGDTLRGPGLDASGVRERIAAVACAFELVCRRPGWSDRTLQRAVNGSTAGHVLGQQRSGCPDAAALDELIVTVTQGGAEHCRVRGGDVNDNPLDTAAWLANLLAEYDQSVQAGDIILTGTYAGLVPLRAGQHWQAAVGDLPPVELRIA